MTLLELLVVVVIMSILLMVAVPAYLQYRDNAYEATATSNAKSLSLAAGLYQVENYPGSTHDPDSAVSVTDSGYQGMNLSELLPFDPSLGNGMYVNNSGTEATGVTTRAPLDATHYCVYATAGPWFAYQLDPTGSIMATTSPAAVCT